MPDPKPHTKLVYSAKCFECTWRSEKSDARFAAAKHCRYKRHFVSCMTIEIVVFSSTDDD